MLKVRKGDTSTEKAWDTSIEKAWAPPIFRWAGSKRQLLPVLMQSIPSDFARYIEPFAGSACLFFALRPSQAILGDINEELIKTYEIIRSHPRLVARAAHDLPVTKPQYYKMRATRPESLALVERAVRFVYLNRYCFNGVYRTNQKGLFNVPMGVRTGKMPSEQSFYRCALALRNAKLRATDFETCLKDIRPGDFVYLDPPYARSRLRGEYGYDSFREEDIVRLVNVLKSIDEAGAVFLLSYADSPELRSLLIRWRSKKLSVRRHVAGFAKHRSIVSEVLVSNKTL
jgi:DNA adenine methylase